MEKHKCKLCLKSFANGRALGGHMRSHMFSLYVNPKPQHRHSPRMSNLPSEENEDDGDENLKKRFRLRDPEFSFAAGGGGGGSVVLQDRESETESSKNPSFRRRSKRIRRRDLHEFNGNVNEKKSKFVKQSTLESLNSISGTSTDEDVAYCLMMLSRDKWNDNESESESESERTPARTIYRCETCNRIFRSYQALGGHKASHKKSKINHESQNVFMEGKIHECPVCLRVFSSGQALGGHKRSHTPATPVEKQRINLIDLNLPAPVEDEVSQIEVSVVSDGEFVENH